MASDPAPEPNTTDGEPPSSGRHTPARLVTIADVAREAGVHPSTVSRVLNGRARVRRETEARVREAAERLKYRPSHSARGLAWRRSRAVGVLLPDLRNLKHAEFLQGAEEVLGEHGYSLFVCDGRTDPAVQATELNRLMELRVDAVIVTRSFTLARLVAPFLDAGVPVEPVEVLRSRRPLAGSRLRRGSLEAFRHLLDLGHRRFAFFTLDRRDAPRRSAELRGRIGALRHAVAERGLPATSVEVVGVQDADECLSAVARLASWRSRPTALIGAHDWVAALLLRAITTAGLEVPRDVSVVTYGDTVWTEAYRPPISVIRYDYRAEGAALARRALVRLGVIEEPPDPAATMLAPDEFVLRESCGPPPGHRRAARG